MKKLWCTLLLSTIVLLGYGQDNAHHGYIKKYAQIAIEEMERAGIPASIKLAQGLLESDAGRSYLARKGNNHFGIKCSRNWKGKTVMRKDDDYDSLGNLIESCFRAYKNPEASYIAHSEFLRDNARYAVLFRLDPSDYRRWAHGLKKQGYATSATYASKLISLIERYQLHEYDKASNSSKVVRRNENIEKILAKSFPSINDVSYTLLEKDESVKAIAQRTGISTRYLMKFNEKISSTTQRVTAGSYVYLQRKRKNYRGYEKYHTVKADESMYDIAQQYGLRLDKLYERNRMTGNTEPATGEEIKIRGWKVKERPTLKSEQLIPLPDEQPPLPSLETDEDGFLELDEPEEASPELEAPPTDVAPNREETVVITEDPFDRPTPTPDAGTTPVYPPVEENISTSNNSTVTPPTVETTPIPESTAQYYVVQKGDTLYSVSRRFGVSVTKLKSDNSLVSNTIYVGQRLRVR